ncbi:hypothetical protein HBI23_240920 [Parastagonospora nodorum]|nr:hypothetical protein HBI23_240920 [Parastagonospora nodorum]
MNRHPTIEEEEPGRAPPPAYRGLSSPPPRFAQLMEYVHVPPRAVSDAPPVEQMEQPAPRAQSAAESREVAVPRRLPVPSANLPPAPSRTQQLQQPPVAPRNDSGPDPVRRFSQRSPARRLFQDNDAAQRLHHPRQMSPPLADLPSPNQPRSRPGHHATRDPDTPFSQAQEQWLARMLATMRGELRNDLREFAERSRTATPSRHSQRGEAPAQSYLMTGGRGGTSPPRHTAHTRSPVRAGHGLRDDLPHHRSEAPAPSPGRLDRQYGRTLSPRGESGTSRGRSGCQLSARESRMAEDNERVKQMGGTIKFHADTIGYFFPNMSRAEHPKDTVEIGGRTHYRHVRDFIDAAERAILTHSMPEHVIRNNLHMCFKGTAILWFQSELSVTAKLQVLDGDGIVEWVKMLTRKYHQQPAIALKRLTSETYTTGDLAKDRSPAEWCMTVMRLCQDAELGGQHQYAAQAWNLLDPWFQMFVPMPSRDTALSDFICVLEEKFPVLRQQLLANQQRNGKYDPRQFANDPRLRGVGVPVNENDYANSRSHPRVSNPYYRGQRTGAQSDRPGPRPDYDTQKTRGPANGYASRNHGNGPPAQNPQPSDRRPSDGKNGYYNRDNRNAGQPQREDVKRNNNPRYDKPQGVYHGRPEEAPPSPVQERTEHGERPTSCEADHDDARDRDAQDWDDDPRNWGQHEDRDRTASPAELHYSDHDDDELNNYWLDPTYLDEDVPQPQGIPQVCKFCHQHFCSGNKLHMHLRSNCRDRQTGYQGNVYAAWSKIALEEKATLLPVTKGLPKEVAPGDIPCIKSSAPAPPAGLRGIQNWYYVKMPVQAGPNSKVLQVTPDTGAAYSLADRAFVEKNFPNAHWEDLPQPISTGGVGKDKVLSKQSVCLTLYIPSRRSNGERVFALWRVCLFVIDHLAPKILLGMDTLAPQEAIIDLKASKLIQPRCQGVTTSITYRPRDQTARKIRKLTAGTTVFVPAHSAVRVPIHVSGRKPLSECTDYHFKAQDLLKLPHAATYYNAVIKHDTTHVLVRNDTSRSVVVQRRTPLGHAVPAEADRIYAIDPAEHALAAMPDLHNGASRETKLDNGVTVFGSPGQVKQLAEIVMEHPKLWTDRRTHIDIPEEQWMQVPLKQGWENHKFSTKVYPVGAKDKEVIDKVFDKLHDDGRMDWAQRFTPFGVPVFVTRKTGVDDNGQPVSVGRPVIDMRDVNDWILKDSYPLTDQNDILNAMSGAAYYTVVDGLSYFYQFPIRKEDRHIYAINSHWGQEILNVAGMGFRNSVQHVQRQGDLILKDMRHFARAYVDDFVVFSNTWEEHLQHLRMFLKRLDQYRFSLSPKKAFIGYPTIELLGQRVDAFGLSSTEERIAAMRNLAFPRTAADLETYIGAISFLRDKTPYLTQLARPLEELKTELLREAPKKRGHARKKYAMDVQIREVPALREAFEDVQSLWNNTIKTFHAVRGRPLYLDVDSSKAYGMGAMLYHVKGDPAPEMEDSDLPLGIEDDEMNPVAWLKKVKDFAPGSIQPVVFLSKNLTPPERRYAPTELEMAGLTWAIRKVRHLVESAPKVYVFTDHSAVTAIARQKRLTGTASLAKMNLRLVNASMYLQQFPNLDVRYRPGRCHIVPDALSRLENTEPSGEDHLASTLDDLPHVFHTLLIEMSDALKDKLRQGYLEDPVWKRVKEVCEGTKEDKEYRPLPQGDEEDTGDDDNSTIALTETEGTHSVKPKRKHYPLAGLRFTIKDGLIYYHDGKDGTERLCVPDALTPGIFKQAHDECYHQGFERTYDRVRASFYIYRLARKLRAYLTHCPQCMLNRTHRHRRHGDYRGEDYQP